MASSFLSPTFIIGQFRIGSVEGASCVNMGNNLPAGFTSRKMHNQGFGSVGGDGNSVTGARSFLQESSGLQPQPEGTDSSSGIFGGEDAHVPRWIRDLIADSFHEEEEDPVNSVSGSASG